MCPLRYVLVLLSLLVLGITLMYTGKRDNEASEEIDVADGTEQRESRPAKSKWRQLWEMSCGIYLWDKFKAIKAKPA